MAGDRAPSTSTSTPTRSTYDDAHYVIVALALAFHQLPPRLHLTARTFADFAHGRLDLFATMAQLGPSRMSLIVPGPAPITSMCKYKVTVSMVHHNLTLFLYQIMSYFPHTPHGSMDFEPRVVCHPPSPLQYYHFVHSNGTLECKVNCSHNPTVYGIVT